MLTNVFDCGSLPLLAKRGLVDAALDFVVVLKVERFLANAFKELVTVH
jgi:hypothetical protein